MRTGPQRAFSLIELMVVIAIMALLIGLATPAFISINRDSQLTQGGQMLIDECSFARQTALTKNQSVELRFYSYANANSSVRHYQAIQSFILDDNNKATPIGRIRYLPATILMDSNSQLSTLLGPDRVKTWSDVDQQPALPGIGIAYDTRVFKFQPGGSTDLSQLGQQWFVTLHRDNLGDNLSKLPANYYVIQINPLIGTMQGYRP